MIKKAFDFDVRDFKDGVKNEWFDFCIGRLELDKLEDENNKPEPPAPPVAPEAKEDGEAVKPEPPTPPAAPEVKEGEEHVKPEPPAPPVAPEAKEDGEEAVKPEPPVPPVAPADAPKPGEGPKAHEEHEHPLPPHLRDKAAQTAETTEDTAADSTEVAEEE